MFKVNNKNTRTTSIKSFWCFSCYIWTYFTPFSNVSIVDFEQVNFKWVTFIKHINLLFLLQPEAYSRRTSNLESFVIDYKPFRNVEKNVLDVCWSTWFISSSLGKYICFLDNSYMDNHPELLWEIVILKVKEEPINNCIQLNISVMFWDTGLQLY